MVRDSDTAAEQVRKAKRARRLAGSPREGQYDLELKPVARLFLPDKIPSNVHTLFVGVNPGMRSATIGHYFGGRNNYFWKLVSASGIWPSSLTTFEDDTMVEAGFGFTDTCKRPSPSVATLTKADFISAKNRISKLVHASRPKMVVFVSKTAYRVFLGNLHESTRYGLQQGNIDGVKVFVVPSTSGRSLKDSSYRTKLVWFKRLRDAVDYWRPQT